MHNVNFTTGDDNIAGYGSSRAVMTPAAAVAAAAAAAAVLLLLWQWLSTKVPA